MMTFNRYVTEGIEDGSILREEFQGIAVYRVRRPLPGEPVDGYTNTSAILAWLTPTDLASREED